MGRRGKCSWAVFALLVLTAATVLSVLAANATPKAFRLTQSVSVDYSVDDPRFRQTLERGLQAPILDGNRADMLENGEAIYPAKLDAIAAAETSISFEVYEFWGETAGAEFAEALRDAAERGVTVRVLLDFVGSTGADADSLAAIEDAGGQVVRWRQPSWYQAARFNHRTHRKLLIVDGRTGFTGGANIGDDWLGNPQSGGKRDLHYRLEGPIVGALQGAFAEHWLNATGELLHGEAIYPALEPIGNLAMQVVDSAPREGRHRIRWMLLFALAAAQERVDIGTAYFYPDRAVLDALEAAAERGVRVRILVPGDSIDKGFVRHASVNQWQPLLEAGVEIHEFEPTMYHAKLLVVDDRWVSVGSANMDNRSFRINDEVNVNVFDADFARGIRETLDRDLDQAARYDLERWQARAWHKRLFGWISVTLGSHF